MTFMHHGLEVLLPDDWWAEAGMVGFVPKSKTYRVGKSDKEILDVCIDDVGPVLRSAGVGTFNDSIEEGPARMRAVRLLRGFRLGDAIPPVEVIEGSPEYPYRYKLFHGTHRLYCSLGAGFTHVPAVASEPL